MSNLRRRLPSLAALIAFESAARLGNLTQAAAELNVTQAAISRQIRILESFVGRPVFERLPRGVQPTIEGRALQQRVTDAFSDIADAFSDLKERSGPPHLTIVTTIAVATFWLMPRIGRFRAKHPSIEFRFIAQDTTSNLAADSIDAAIRYGTGNWRGVTSTFLFQDEMIAICSPAYLRAHGGVIAPRSLRRHKLVHLETTEPDWAAWSQMLDFLELPPQLAEHGLAFNNFAILLQAVLAGEGIAVASKPLVSDLIREGRIVQALSQSLSPGSNFYFVTKTRSTEPKGVSLLRRWLLEEVKEAGLADPKNVDLTKETALRTTKSGRVR
jgi:DNA-binding transcriptional LysR family regulator